jgi:methyl-accepting chemotaxis protein
VPTIDHNLFRPSGASIKRRLILSFMTTTGLTLLLVSGAIFVTEVINFRARMINEVSVLAQVVGTNSAASLLFNDVEAAEETLAALKANTHVIAAVIYDAEEAPFAAYLRSEVKNFEAPTEIAAGHIWTSQTLDLIAPVVVQGEDLGSVFVRVDTEELSQFIVVFVGVVAVVSIAALLVCWLGATILRRQIATPLADLVEGAERMAKGDLSVQVAVASEDEIGTLARAFNGMASNLRSLVAQVGENTQSVAGVTARLGDAAEAMSGEASRQESAVDETAESIERMHISIRDVNEDVETLNGTALETAAAASQMDGSIGQIAAHIDSLSETIDGSASSVVEMTTAIREIAQSAESLNNSTESTSGALSLLSKAVDQVQTNARETYELSDQASGQAAEGIQSVEETVGGMQEIQASFQGLESVISDLAEKSESIGEVIKVIEGVVEQTNLLALNAAIISSQAGEHGRAFSVVADEVRNLAERTAGSTREISGLIESVQDGVKTAVGAMQLSSQRVESGVSLSRRAGELLRGIGESAQASAERVSQIVESTEGQARDIEKVGHAMGELRSVSEQLNRGTHEQDNASADITRAFEQMRSLGQQVKLSTQEQRKESSMITHSVGVVASRIESILINIKDQSKQGDQIREALQVFREVSKQAGDRRVSMEEGLRELAECSEGLDSEIGRFSL